MLVPYEDERGIMVVEGPPTTIVNWQSQQGIEAFHNEEKKVLKDTNEIIASFQSQLVGDVPLDKLSTMTQELALILGNNVQRLQLLEEQQQAAEQIAFTQDAIQDRLLMQALRDNTQLLVATQQKLIIATAEKNAVENELVAVRNNNANTDNSLALTIQKSNQDNVEFINEIKRLNQELETVVKTSSQLAPTQQELALVTEEKNNLALQMNNLLREYNMTKETVSHELALYKQESENLRKERDSLITTLNDQQSKQLVLYNEANARINADEQAIAKLIEEQNQRALVIQDEFNRERNKFREEMDRLQRDLSEKQSTIVRVQQAFDLYKLTDVKQIESDRDNLSRLLERAKNDQSLLELKLKEAQERTQNEIVLNQAIQRELERAREENRLCLTTGEDQHTQQLALRDGEIDELGRQLIALRNQLTVAQQETGQLTRKQADDSATIETLNKTITTLKSSITSTEQKNKEIRDREERERMNLSAQISTLNTQLSDANTAIRKQTQALVVAQTSETERLLAEIQTLTTKSQKDAQTIVNLERTIEDNKRAIALSTSDPEKEVLKNELLRVETQLKSEKSRTAQLELDLQQTNKRLADSKPLEKTRTEFAESLQKELEKTRKDLLQAVSNAQSLSDDKVKLNGKLNDLMFASDRIQLYELRDDRLITLASKLDATDINNRDLLRVPPSIRSTLEDALRRSNTLQKMEIFVGGAKGAFRTATASDLVLLNNYVLATKTLVKRLYDETQRCATIPKTGGSGISRPKPIFTLGASALHALNHLEMTAQAEWLGLAHQLSLPGEYNVDVEFSREAADISQSKEFHFEIRDVHLLVDPNNKEAGERFFVIDLTRPSNRAIFSLGSIGVADVIHAKGLIALTVRDKESAKVVKELALAYEFVPQKTLQYNTKVSARVGDDVTIHARYLGSSYIIEDILIHQ